MRPGIVKIFSVLMSERQGLTFTELKKQVGLSSPVLSDYLSLMQTQGVVVRDSTSRKYLLSKVYYPMESFANDYQKSLKLFLAAIPNQAVRIGKIDDVEKRKEAFIQFLDASFSFFTLAIWKVIGESMDDFTKKEELKNQKLVLEINSTINNAVHDWIAPMANALAISIGYNYDLIDIGDEFFEKKLEETSEKMSNLRIGLERLS